MNSSGGSAMVEVLFNNEKEILSVFQLLGIQENDISKSIIWILKECPVVLESSYLNAAV